MEKSESKPQFSRHELGTICAALFYAHRDRILAVDSVPGKWNAQAARDAEKFQRLRDKVAAMLG
jgi:hypothetical protein